MRAGPVAEGQTARSCPWAAVIPRLRVVRLSPLLAGLDPEQLHAVTTASQPLVIRAGAGSGKTRVLTRRVAHRAALGDLEPRHALCVTFTREAAAELRGRLRGLGLRDLPAAGTFHAVALGLLRARWHDQRQNEPELLADRGVLLRRIAGTKLDRATVARVTVEIDWARARGIRPDRYREALQRNRRSLNIDVSVVESLYGDFEAAKRKAKLIDFDDLLERCADAFRSDSAFATAQRWRFRHLFVDEFQDVNPLQFRLLQAWLGEGRDLCAVGDANQAIYGWNGADPSLFERLTDLLDGGEVVQLNTNHRSSPAVVAVSGAALPAGRAPQPVVGRPDGVPPKVLACRDADHELATITQQLRDWKNRGVAWRDQAVLVRTNAQATALVDGLAAAGLPTARAGASPAALLRRLPPAGSDLAWEDLVEQLADPTLAALAEEYTALDLRPSPAAFLRWAATATADEGVTFDAIRVGTFHRAKGREWRAVIVAGVEDGFVPATTVRLDEERRLFYVALSRATELLVCTWAASRVLRGASTDRVASPFLAAVEAACDQASATDAPRPMPLAVAAALRRSPPVTNPGSLDTLTLGQRRARRQAHQRELRLEALQRWRASQAKLAKVDPRVVLDDAVLAALAADPPDDVAALAARPGIGPMRATRFGSAVLQALRSGSPEP